MRPSLAILRIGVWITAAAASAWGWTVSVEKPSSPAPPSGVVLLRNLPHRAVDGRRLALDLYLPEAAIQAPGAPHPVVIAVHGGSWMGGSKTDYGPQFARLAQRGIAVAVVDYRLARPGAPSWPGAVADITSALDWLEAHAAEHRLDTGRVAAIGTSSGGLLAALAASEDRRIRAVVCLSAPMDLPKLTRDRSLAHEPALVFLGAEPQGLSSRASAASPIVRATADQAPMLLIHGTEDAWVSVEQARNMQIRLDELGASCRLIEVVGARHGFQLMVGEPAPRDLLPDALGFLEEVWEAGR